MTPKTDTDNWAEVRAASQAVLPPESIRLLHYSAWWLTALAGLTRLSALMRNAGLQPKSTLKTALGIKHPVIRQVAQGFMGGSYNTKDYRHGQSPATMSRIKISFLLLVFAVPLLVLPWQQGTATLLAVLILQYVGLLCERWYFFADAAHTQNLYYQTRN